MVILQRAWYAVFALCASGDESFLARLLVIVPQCFQLALRKFRCFTGLLVVVMWKEAVIREGRCCDRGNFPSTRLSRSWQDVLVFTKARSGLVSDFQHLE